MMDITKSQSDFEAWFDSRYAGILELPYFNLVKVTAMEAWQASRESIEVELPELCGDGENDTDYIEGLNDGIIQSARALHTAGIRIKGESDGTK